MSQYDIVLNDGNHIPWLGFGTGTALYKQNATKSVIQAIEAGVTHFDGAQVYGNEDTLGEGIKASGKPRSMFFVTTKLNSLSGDQTAKDTLLDSLKKLGLTYVDLFLIHDPTPHQKEGRLREVWAQMEQVKDEGFSKSIGVSNFRVSDLEEILPGAKVIPSVNQIELHPYVWKDAQPLVEFCKKHQIVIASYSGLTPLTRSPNGPLKDVLPMIRARLEQTCGAPVTEGQVLSKWILQKGAIVITCVIYISGSWAMIDVQSSTSAKVARSKEFLDTERVPDLTKEEIGDIEEAGSKFYQRIYARHVFND